MRMGILDTSIGKIEYQMIFSKRKTVGICIEPEKGVTVRVPKYMSIKTVDSIVSEKEDWIVKKSLEMKKNKDEKPERNYVDGESVLYMGKSYPLRINKDKSIKKSNAIFNGESIEILLSGKNKGTETEIVKKILISWYKEQATLYTKERVEFFSAYCKGRPKQIIVKEQKRRWGSCSQRGVIRINWRCIMAPEEVFDYIIMHEMCHLKHMNHGDEFWEMVEKIMPDYRNKKLWLKQHGYSLDL